MQLPNLPGYSFRNHRKNDFRRPQICQIALGGRFDPTTISQRPPLLDELDKTIQVNSRSITATAPPTQPIETFPDYIPAHVAYEHLVLRFYAYFRENVPESAEETYRVRYVKIMVYLEDDTVMIEENHVRNSGIEQGVLLRRMRVLDPSSGELGYMYTKEDFKIGINIEIFGVVYHIYACDQFTEEYFASVGRELGEFEQPPDDLYTIKRRLTERPIRVTYTNTDKTNLRRFLEFDGKVLRFYAIWDDRKSLFGERRKFTLQYFLVDGTIEIRQVLVPNAGRDTVSMFLRKHILKKPGTDEPYTDKDLYIGQTVNAFGREFFLYDADKFTRDFLDNKFGKRDWTPIKVDEPPRFSGVEHVYPPYNGWGDEEDSLGYCQCLHPRPPRKDVRKMIEKDGQLLRYAARFPDPSPQDRGRRFVIVYYLADDTVGVFELPRRNSGFAEGKFIQRAKWKNGDNNQYFRPYDFEVGKVISISGFKFVIDDADEYALNYMEADTETFPQSDLFDIITHAKENVPKCEEVKRFLEGRDPDLTGYVDPRVAQDAIMKIMGFNEHHALTIVRRWTAPQGFDYFGFFTALN